MPQPPLTIHEAMEVHELLNFETICAMKAKGMEGLVTDRELKALMEQILQQSIQAIEKLQPLLAGLPLSGNQPPSMLQQTPMPPTQNAEVK
ncbi:hypothetical protein [Alicyclobacillus acidoterrestris]|uniref:Uncharacterized protein n=1 Tax=Alicyclobacillus acidoterrestris (strain ATCC 49025 / DSM 3922 / CIP 106132 / NCIMB 13137 / GD3B) TaxID=1356854 RepID=T0BRX1_ALIAG|nr:hypothetical protein [Alicyclobacillus acidoterrestris]EPZ43514.1 hypothetical protein N007_12460 [Alicyclobacillus acidoterrestris ATCC 49025]UNO50193.1 hypothetical protein K1I37_06890 [Alicyclobacillus acidoterrestris]